MKRWGKQNPIRFDEKELNTDLGEDNFIFVGSSNDMFAEGVPKEWIEKTIAHCYKYEKNKYLFQTKNPKEFWRWCFPAGTVLGTTIESNRDYKISDAPKIKERIDGIIGAKKMGAETIKPNSHKSRHKLNQNLKTHNKCYIGK